MLRGWLHDFGKVATPEHIMNKSTKLECLFDKIDLLILKFEILKRDKKVDFYKNSLDENSNIEDLKLQLKSDLDKIDKDIKFLKDCNVGGEFMSDGMKIRIDEISNQMICVEDKEINVIGDDEKKNLKISRGTLSDSDFDIMKEHVSLSYELLSKLPYPKHLKNVPFYAGCHHEKINGRVTQMVILEIDYHYKLEL